MLGAAGRDAPTPLGSVRALIERFGHPGYRGLLLAHLVDLSGGTLALSTVVDLLDEPTAARG